MIHSVIWRECANSSDVGVVALSVSMGTWRLVRAGPGLSVWIGGEKTDVGGLTSAHRQLLTSRVYRQLAFCDSQLTITPFYKEGMSRKTLRRRLEAGAALESEAVINLFWTGIPLAFNRSQLFIPAS